MDIKNVELLDITKPEVDVTVETQHRPNGMVLYVHVDGITVLRICQIAINKFSVVAEGERIYGDGEAVKS